MAATSVRVNNDTERDVSLLWHRYTQRSKPIEFP